MVLSETQEKELIQLYRDMREYWNYLEHRTYHPYSEMKRFTLKLREIIGEKTLEDALNKKECTKY